MSKRKASEAGYSRQPEVTVINVHNLPIELREELNQAAIQYPKQIKLQKCPPNHVQFKKTLQALINEYERHVKRLRKIKEKYLNDNQSYIGDDYGMVIRDDDVHIGDQNLIWDETPRDFICGLMSESKAKLSNIGLELNRLPIRKEGERKNRALNLFFSKVISIYIKAGGTPELRENKKKEPEYGPFLSFADDAGELIGYIADSDRALFDLLKALLKKRQPAPSNT